MLGDNPAVFLGYGWLQSLRLSKQDCHSSSSGGEVTGAVSPWPRGRLLPLLSSLPRRGQRPGRRHPRASLASSRRPPSLRSAPCPSGVRTGSQKQSPCSLQLSWKEASPSPPAASGMETAPAARQLVASPRNLGWAKALAEAGRGAAAPAGLPGPLWRGRLEALQTPLGFSVNQPLPVKLQSKSVPVEARAHASSRL